MKRILACLLAMTLALQVTACAAPAAVSVAHAGEDKLELALEDVPESRIITAAYYGGRMVGCAVNVVLAGTTAVVARFGHTLPQGSIFKSFVLDRDSASPLLPAQELTLPEESRVLVAYFSATGNTRAVAEKVAEVSGGDLFEIVPAQPYTSADLNYNTDCRANAEQNDPDARPAIANAVENMERYDAVLIGYPIWWGKAPKIIHTFLETYDLSGKTIASFCTSGSSSHEDATLRGYEPDATWLTGRRFSGTAQVEEWVNGLDLPKATEEETNQMYIQIGDTVWTATLEDNPSVTAWRELLNKGPLTVEMHDYGGFEKVGSIGTTIAQSNRQITTKPGDIILYQGNSVTIYYGENSWNFTPLGHLDGVTDAELRQVLKAGGEDISVTFSLTRP